MRILHTSDWHLGISLHNMSLLKEQEFFIEQIGQIVMDNRIDAVIIAGDVYDTSISSSEAMRLFNRAMTILCLEQKVQVLIIAGNHDGAARLSICSDLLRTSGLHITGRLVRDIVPVVIGNCAFYCIPYFNIDEVRYLYPEIRIDNYSQAMQTVLEDIRKNMNTDLKNIVISHSFVSGAELSDSDHGAMVGTTNMVPGSIFDGFYYVALGHLHRPQKLGDRMYYSGSPFKYSFSEAGIDKSVLMIDTDADSVDKISLPCLHDVREISGTYNDIVAFAAQDSRRDDYVSVHITDRYATGELHDFFRGLYPHMAFFSGQHGEECGISAGSLSSSDVERLDAEALMKLFMQDVFPDFKLETEQMELFRQACLDVEQEDRS